LWKDHFALFADRLIQRIFGDARKQVSEEKGRQMSRQTRSKSSSDFVREKTDEGETRDFA